MTGAIVISSCRIHAARLDRRSRGRKPPRVQLNHYSGLTIVHLAFSCELSFSASFRGSNGGGGRRFSAPVTSPASRSPAGTLVPRGTRTCTPTTGTEFTCAFFLLPPVSARSARCSPRPLPPRPTISTAVTTLRSRPAASDDIRITSTGSVKPTGGAAVTINSNNSVKNEGTIAIKGANGSTGILANTNLTGDITNSGTITIDEDYTPTDTDKDGDLDGPFAQGSDRFGIHVLGGGTYTGNIVNSGTITIEGNQSAGIAIDSALTGSLTRHRQDHRPRRQQRRHPHRRRQRQRHHRQRQHDRRPGPECGRRAARRRHRRRARHPGHGDSTGYRSTTAPADTSKLDADDLLQGGSAVVVGGSVAAESCSTPSRRTTARPTPTDHDGIPDATKRTAHHQLRCARNAIGSATQDINIGASSRRPDAGDRDQGRDRRRRRLYRSQRAPAFRSAAWATR